MADRWANLVGRPRVIFQAANVNAAKLGAVSTESPTLTSFGIRSLTAPAASASYVWDYQVIG